MIDLETINLIRHKYYGEHWTEGTIATELGVHHDTVTAALSDAPRTSPAPRPSGFDPYADFVRETLQRYPKLRATRLWQMIRARGCTLSVRQVRDKVAEIRPIHREAFLKRRTFPGEEAQVDWASFGRVTIGKASRALSAFIMTLTYSRRMFVRFFLDQSMENFLRGHVYAFRDIGGVPRYCVYDNLRSAVLARHGGSVRFNPRLLELASHYHYAPRACRPRRGNEKGGVERAVRHTRDSFFAARSFATLDALNRDVLEWEKNLARQRPWPGDDRKTVEQAFEEEAPHLLPPPVNDFETDLVTPVRSYKTIYVRFDLNDYSIPPDSVGRPLSLIASETTVRIVDGTSQIAQHKRSYDRHCNIDDDAHIEALLIEKRRARGSVPRARLIDAVPATEAFLEASFERGDSVAITTEKLLLLLDDYGADELRAAVGEALSQQTPRLSSVAFLLARRRRWANRKTALPVDLSRRPDLKDLYVKPHSSETYDALSRRDDDDDDKRD